MLKLYPLQSQEYLKGFRSISHQSFVGGTPCSLTSHKNSCATMNQQDVLAMILLVGFFIC